MGDVPTERLNSRSTTVQQDWLAWLPEAKESLFQAVFDDLEVSYTILSVALDDAFTLCNQGRFALAREQAVMFSGLFDRLAGRLRGTLRTLDEHGRQFGTTAMVVPLQVDLFRNDQAQTVARANYLFSMVSLRRPGRFFRKVTALEELVVKLQAQVHKITREIGNGATVSIPVEWANLEMLHHDLNTCFCETTIIVKSFLCAMPDAELLSFRTQVLSLLAATVAVASGRPATFTTKIGTAHQPEAAASPASEDLAPRDLTDSSENARRRRLNT